MFAVRLVNLIETHADRLSEGLLRKLETSEQYSELFHRVPPDELQRRTHEIYRNLSDWLLTKTEWERGAGETLACGTGACAAVVAGIRQGLLDEVVQVATRGGHLTIRWAGAENNLNCAVWMTGPAVAVFEGEIEIES